MSTDNAWLERSVDELELSVRSAAALQATGITTIRQLVGYSKSELLATRKFGTLVLSELEELLEEMGLGLRTP